MKKRGPPPCAVTQKEASNLCEKQLTVDSVLQHLIVPSLPAVHSTSLEETVWEESPESAKATREDTIAFTPNLCPKTPPPTPPEGGGASTL